MLLICGVDVIKVRLHSQLGMAPSCVWEMLFVPKYIPQYLDLLFIKICTKIVCMTSFRLHCIWLLDTEFAYINWRTVKLCHDMTMNFGKNCFQLYKPDCTVRLAAWLYRVLATFLAIQLYFPSSAFWTFLIWTTPWSKITTLWPDLSGIPFFSHVIMAGGTARRSWQENLAIDPNQAVVFWGSWRNFFDIPFM